MDCVGSGAAPQPHAGSVPVFLIPVSVEISRKVSYILNSHVYLVPSVMKLCTETCELSRSCTCDSIFQVFMLFIFFLAEIPKCCYCFWSWSAHAHMADHMIPTEEGGSLTHHMTSLSDMQICRPCSFDLNYCTIRSKVHQQRLVLCNCKKQDHSSQETSTHTHTRRAQSWRAPLLKRAHSASATILLF